jgi:hypothetical protein
MRRIDALFTTRPFFGARRIARTLSEEGFPIDRKRVRRLMRLMGIEALGAEAENDQARSGTQDLSLPAARSDDRAAKPSLGGRRESAAGSGVRDGGWSPAIGLQERVANHRKRRWSKARVVSVTEKARKGVR